MPLITDPDSLLDSATDNASQAVFINTTTKTIKLVVFGLLSTDGVTLKCLYSFLKEQWRNDINAKNLAAFPFPMVPITDESFEFVDGWDLANDTSRYLIRTGGWTVRNSIGSVIAKWAGIIGLGTIESNDQLYYQQTSLSGSFNVQLAGQVNQAVQILSDPNGDGIYTDGFDRRTFFKLFVREAAQTYDDANLSEIGVTSLDSIAYRFPISTATDLKITNADNIVSGSAPYAAIKVRYFDQPFNREVDSAVNRNFGIVIDVGTHSGVDGSAPGATSVLTTVEGGMTVNAFSAGTLRIHEGTNENVTYPIVSNTATTITVTGTLAVGTNLSFTAKPSVPIVATAEQIYERIQYLLRQNVDIDVTDLSVIGKTADLLLRFVGNTLECGTLDPVNPNGGGNGVVIEGFSSADTNRLTFRDNTGVSRSYPFVAVLTLQFGANLVADPSAKFWVYFSTLPGATNDFGESGALLVNDALGTGMTGTVSAQTSIVKTFNYDANTQGGRTAITDADITVVAIGLTTGQYVRAITTIARSTSNSVSLVAPLERNYQNL